MRSKSTIATFAILLATLLWGMTFSFIKEAVSLTSPFNFIFWRTLIACILLVLLLGNKIIFRKPLILAGIALGLSLGGTVIFQTIGLQYTNASTASFITGLSVIFVTIFSCFIAGKAPSINVLLAILIAIYGVALITLGKGMEINVGDIWILLCAVCFAIYIILAGKFSHLNQAITLTFFQLLTIFILTAFFNFSRGEFAVPHLRQVWIDIIFCALFASVIAFILQNRFQRYLSSTKTAIIFATEPIFATLTAAIYLREPLTIRFVIGAAFIFLAIFISELRLKKKALPQD